MDHNRQSNRSRGKRLKNNQPDTVTETEVKILWDFEIRTDRVIPARRPDIVVLNKTNRTATIIDIAVPSDRNIKTKEREKIEKYQDLRLEIQRSIVIGALGNITSELEGYLNKLPGNHRLAPLLKAALLGSAHILRKILDLPESW